MNPADAARAYTAARREQTGAIGADVIRTTGLVDLAYHDLLVALDEPCDCDPGTCPRACPICEDGATLEADGRCDRCGRTGSCTACAEGDCAHLTAERRPDMVATGRRTVEVLPLGNRNPGYSRLRLRPATLEEP